MTDLPNGWIATRLQSICELNPGVEKKAIAAEAHVSFVPMSAIEAETGKIDVSEIRTFQAVRKGYTSFRKGDVLFAKITPCMENGKVAIVPDLESEYGFGSSEFHVLRPAGGIDPRFLYHVITNRAFRSHAKHNMTGAVGQKRVPISILAEHEIGLPPTNEQRRIVERIETIFSEINSSEKRLFYVKQLLEIYKQSLLKAAFEGRLTSQWRRVNIDTAENLKMLECQFGKVNEDRPLRELPHGWGVIKISKLVETQANGRPFQQGWSPRCERHPAVKGKWGVLKTTAIQDGLFQPGENKALPNTLKPRPQIEIKRGDILMTCAGPRNRCGVVCIVEENVSKLMLSGKMYRFRPRAEALDSRFLTYFISFSGIQNRINEMKTGISDSGLNLTQSRFSKLPVIVPPLKEQELIVRHLDSRLAAIRTLKMEIDCILCSTEALRESVRKLALAGHLVPQNPDDQSAFDLISSISHESVIESDDLIADGIRI